MNFRSSLLTVIVVLIAAPLQAQWLNQRTPGIPRAADGKPNLSAPAPRTPDGKPNLSGLWNRISPKYARNIAADLKPEEIQPWARALVDERLEDLGKGYMNVLCVPLGPSYTTIADSTGAEQMKIIQTPALILILNPDLTYRQIFMDGRKLESNPDPSWMGYSVGHWEGDTLVVDSNGFKDKTWLDHDGHPHTEALRMTERYRRTDFGHLEIAVTFQDSGAYDRPWTVPVHATLTADTELLESVCNEYADNGLQHWVGKVSDAEKSAAKVAREVLARYVGVYKGQYIRGPREVEITLSGGTLFAAVNGGPKTPIIPQSETDFTGTGLTYQFIRDGQGRATHVIEGHVSGDYKYERQK